MELRMVSGFFIVPENDMHLTVLDRQRLCRQAKMSLYITSMLSSAERQAMPLKFVDG